MTPPCPSGRYGQTNCWILPHEKDGSDAWYVCHESATPNELVITGLRAAQNMAFQNLTPEFGKVRAPIPPSFGVASTPLPR